jgi:hypothetical protein
MKLLTTISPHGKTATTIPSVKIAKSPYSSAHYSLVSRIRRSQLIHYKLLTVNDIPSDLTSAHSVKNRNNARYFLKPTQSPHYQYDPSDQNAAHSRTTPRIHLGTPAIPSLNPLIASHSQ